MDKGKTALAGICRSAAIGQIVVKTRKLATRENRAGS